MDIKKKIKEHLSLLNEDKKAKYEYACTMCYISINKDKWNEIQDMIKENDLYLGTEKDGDMYGREESDSVHITVLYGTHLDVPNEDVYNIIKTFEKPDIEFKSISMFEPKFPYDVIKFDIKSDKLKEYNKRLRKLPYTSDFDTYHAHCTVAYVKKGKGKEYIKKLKDFKITDKDFTIDKWVYSKEGKKKSFKIN